MTNLSMPEKSSTASEENADTSVCLDAEASLSVCVFELTPHSGLLCLPNVSGKDIRKQFWQTHPYQ